ncbi:MAG: sugar transferase [Spirochaetaceae bacterium]|nr:sugar transferase [Spirochaetaceae bacterium]
MKRFFDIFFSSLAILVLSPLLIPIIIILKLTGEHYIFYTQERMGKGEKPFLDKGHNISVFNKTTDQFDTK